MLGADFSASVAGRTDRSLFAVCRAVSVTFLTHNCSRNFYFLFYSGKSLFQRNFKIITQIRAVLSLTALGAVSAPAHKVRKNITENITLPLKKEENEVKIKARFNMENSPTKEKTFTIANKNAWHKEKNDDRVE